MKIQLIIKTLLNLSLFSLAVLPFIAVSHAETEVAEVVSVGGREVILNNDGTWKYRSTDRYVTTKDGTRVRLKDDGSWQTMGNAPITSKQQVRTSELDIKLNKVVIETYKKKVLKNTSVKTQTVFYLQLNYSPLATTSLSINNSDISLIEVKDNNGKNYPVLSIKAGAQQLQPSTETTIVVRAEKSPSIWDDVRSMQIILKTGLFDLETPITLSQATEDFEELNVAGFDKTE